MKKLLLVIISITVLTGCGTGKSLITDTRKAFDKKKEERLAFTVPQYSVVSFRPAPEDDTFSKESLAEQKVELDGLVTFFGGSVNTDCPVFTLEDLDGFVAVIGKSKTRKRKKTQGYARFVNETGTFYFDTQPEKRKKPYGVVISDGTRPPKIIWGTKGYLKAVKKYFGIASYSELKEKIAQRAPYTSSEESVAEAEKSEWIPEDDIDIPLTKNFAHNFLSKPENARRIFNYYNDTSIRKKTVVSHNPDGTVDTQTFWYDRFGFPEKLLTDNGFDSIAYKRNEYGLIAQQIRYESDKDGKRKVSSCSRFRYESGKVTEFHKHRKLNLWQPVVIYYLDNSQRVNRRQDVRSNIEHNTWYEYDKNGRHIKTKTIAGDYKAVDLYEYDSQDRVVLARFGLSIDETKTENSWWQKTTYFDAEKKAEMTNWIRGETDTSVIYYNSRGDALHNTSSDGYKWSNHYEYYK